MKNSPQQAVLKSPQVRPPLTQNVSEEPHLDPKYLPHPPPSLPHAPPTSIPQGHTGDQLSSVTPGVLRPSNREKDSGVGGRRGRGGKRGGRGSGGEQAPLRSAYFPNS